MEPRPEGAEAEKAGEDLRKQDAGNAVIGKSLLAAGAKAAVALDATALPSPSTPELFARSPALPFMQLPEGESGESELLVATLRGTNAPGVTLAVLDAVQLADAPVRLRDAAQYVVEGSLVLSLIFQFKGANSIKMMQALLQTARDLDMQLDFEFPSAEGIALSPKRHPSCHSTRSLSIPGLDRVVSICVVARENLPVVLLQALFTYVADLDGEVKEVEHRFENKVEWNGEFDKVDFRVTLPKGTAISRLYRDLTELCWKHSADVVIREFVPMNHPSVKSLIVFGLSDVLVIGNVLEELLKEAGCQALKPKRSRHASPEALAAATLKALKGQPNVQQRLVDRLEFAPGARFVCRALKDIGFRLALISNTGGAFITEAVKQKLGMDYSISPEYGVDANDCFTGEYAGDTGDLEMRKFDFLQLLADKEGIDPRDIIVVGRFMEGQAVQNVHEILDNYGPQIYFHARPERDTHRQRENMRGQDCFTSLLYLIGFSGFDVQALHEQHQEKARHSPKRPLSSDDEVQEYTEAVEDYRLVRQKCLTRRKGLRSRRCLVRIHSNTNDTRRFAQLLDPLIPFQEAGEIEMMSCQQITVASGDAFLGLELSLKGDNPKGPLKDLLFDAHQLRMDMDWDMQLPVSPSSTQLNNEGVLPGRYVVTLVKKPELSVSLLAAAFRHCSDLEVECIGLNRLSWQGDFSALRVTTMVPHGKEADLRNRLLATSQCHEVDIAFQRAGVERWGRRLIAFDMDNTLIQQESINELLSTAGIGDAEVQNIEGRYAKGEITFNEAFREKCQLLKGQNASDLFAAVSDHMVFTTGAHRLCRTLKRLGYKMALLSGSVLQVAREVQRSLGLDYAFANELEVDPETGLLTGCTVGPLVTPERKRVLLARIAEVEGCSLKQAVAVGDGSGDIPMLCAAGLGVAFCGKPRVQELADQRVNSKDLITVLFLLGLSEAVAIQLGDKDAEGNFHRWVDGIATPPRI